MNKAIIIGHLGKDAESGETESGKRWVRLSVATSESWRDKATGEKRERTEWHRIVCWGDGLTAFLTENAKKGGKVMVEGTVQTRKWTKDGQDRFTTEIVVQGAGGVVRLLGRPGEGGGGLPAPEEPDGRYAGSEGVF